MGVYGCESVDAGDGGGDEENNGGDLHHHEVDAEGQGYARVYRIKSRMKDDVV